MEEGTECIASTTEPKHVSKRLWEKFRALEKRVDDTTKRSTEKRIKHLQKTTLANVAKALTHPDDSKIINLPTSSTTDTPESVTPVSLSATVGQNSSKRKRGETLPISKGGGDDECSRDMKDDKDEKQWSKVRELMNVNDHLAGVSHGSLGPRTVLELQIEEAIAAGDLKKAEELSDHMATREFGEKIAKAIDAKNFLEHKHKEEEAVKAKKKKKLHWGFEAKQRWETKSNM